MCSTARPTPHSADVRALLATWATGFDAEATSIETCKRVVDDVTVMQSMLAALQSQAAARAARSGSWRDEGDRSPAHQLARQTGTAVGTAKAMLETGERLQELPALAEVAQRGELSAAQTSAVAALGAVAPELVARFIARAEETKLAELREETARAMASRETDPNAKRQRLRDARSLRHWIAADGSGVLHYQDAPDVVAGVMAQLGPIREALFADARERGEQIRPDALDADAMVAAVYAGAATGRPAAHGKARAAADDPTGQAPHRCAPRAKVLVRIDFDALLRGRPIDGELCEIAGYGPIAVSAVRDMLASGDPFVTAVVTKDEQVRGVAHLGRKAIAHQSTALEWINPTGAVDGCTQAIRLEIDHREMWAKTKLTLTDLLDRLCEHHHDLKSREDWALIGEHSGKRRFVPVADPRHPRNPLRLRRQAQARGDPPAA